MDALSFDSLSLSLSTFHFLRPWFLLGIPLSLMLFFAVKHYDDPQANMWQRLISPELLTALRVNENTVITRNTLISSRVILLLVGLLMSTALAGPAWQKQPQAVFKNDHALVILLDQSLSMYAKDETPSRLVRAKRKIEDVLKARLDGQTALIAYAGDAHTVSPLTDDNETIANLLKALEPNIMPKLGSNPVKAYLLALELIEEGKFNHASILWLTDEVSTKHFSDLQSIISRNYPTRILTLGTEQGAPIPLPNQGFLKPRGEIVIAKLNASEISSQAAKLGISVKHNSLSNSDFSDLLAPTKDDKQESEQEDLFDQYIDNGYWLSFTLLPLLLVLFSRSRFFSIALLASCLILPTDDVQAQEVAGNTQEKDSGDQGSSWENLWHTKAQQGFSAYQAGDYPRAAHLFEQANTPQWQGAANYKAGNFEPALQAFSQTQSANSFYNQANTQAQLGQFEQAIALYEKAIAGRDNFTQAIENKAIIEALLEQLDSEQQDSSDSSDSNDENQDSDNTDSNENSESQEGSESDQQDSSNQQDSDQEQSDGESSEQQQSQENDSDSAESSQENAQSSDEESDQLLDEQAQQAAQENTDDNLDKAEQAQQALSQEDEKADAQNDAEPQAAQTQMQPQLSPLEREKQQALQQWLDKIPDDPSQLLRNKFYYQHQLNQRAGERVDSDSDQAW